MVLGALVCMDKRTLKKTNSKSLEIMTRMYNYTPRAKEKKH